MSLIGLRAEEWTRTARVLARAATERGTLAEHPYMPLAEAKIDADAVAEFWAGQDFDLDTPREIRASNCVYCFLKGDGHLRRLRAHFDDEKARRCGASEHERTLTPCDWQWWVRLEQRYARTLAPVGHEEAPLLPSAAEDTGSASYARLFTRGAYRHELDGVMPCDCTD